MTLRSEYALGHSEFNEFLFAFVGEEKSGMQLTVLSALTRLGLDPWGEAARLSKLTREAATSALATAIATLSEGNWKASDSRSIASRLVKHLPRDGASLPAAREALNQKRKLEVRKWLMWIVIAAVTIIVLSRLFGR